MKKIVLFLSAVSIGVSSSGQFKTKFSQVNPAQDPVIVRKNVQPYESSTANKTTAGGSRWYNHAETSGELAFANIYDATLAGFFYTWPDSTVRFPAPNNNFGISYLSISQMFHPQASSFNDQFVPGNVGKIMVTNSNAYTVDSVRIRGYYNRQFNTYNDTLIFRFVYENPSAKFAFFSYGGSVFTNHGVDSFAAQLWSLSSWFSRPIIQVPYSSGGNPALTAIDSIKVPLTSATFADSLPDGTHYITVAPNINVTAGGKVGLSVTFKPGTAYTSGSTIDNYNNFLFMSHETVADDFVNYFPNDFNMSGIIPKDSANSNINSTLGLYIPTIAFSSGLFAPELHNVSWRVSCPTCVTSVNDIEGALVNVEAYPNPADGEVTISFNVKESANLTLSIANAVGQTVAVQNLGKFSANQSGKTTINVADLSNGVYFYTVEANGQRKTQRFVVAH